MLVYTWRVSGGVIEGEGANVKWNLAGLTPGEYTATVEIDDGCCVLFCETKVTVKPPCCCPYVTVVVPEPTPQESQPEYCVTGTNLVVKADVKGGMRVTDYRWELSAGKIASGQGTPNITVDTSELTAETEITATVTLTVEEGGQTRYCPLAKGTFRWCPIRVEEIPGCKPFDQYLDLTYNDEKARLDNFAIALQSDPRAQGLIIAYTGEAKGDSVKGIGVEGSRVAGLVCAQYRLDRAVRYLVEVRGVTRSQLVTRDGGGRDISSVDLFVCPIGSDPAKVESTPNHDWGATPCVSEGTPIKRGPARGGRKRGGRRRR